ncbi:MAG: hypothetical protein UW87_C0031G0005 [Candidatus Moranbacteria bacterium GW2011_GWC2_45_10]|nr:MAG: hypothetical protein UW87_C0031G0005 [Candidatus Moranbacteria bacterium GW2011_GWC2_45_10]
MAISAEEAGASQSKSAMQGEIPAGCSIYCRSKGQDRKLFKPLRPGDDCPVCGSGKCNPKKLEMN